MRLLKSVSVSSLTVLIIHLAFIPGSFGAEDKKANEPVISDTLEKTKASIVDIQTTGRMSFEHMHPPGFIAQWMADYLEYDANRRLQINYMSTGAGVMIDSSGLVLTNYHVVSIFDEIKVRTSADKIYGATLIGKSRQHDLALLRIEGGGGDFASIEMADSAQAKIADTVYAIGNPYSYSKTVTKGTITATDRQLKLYDGTTFDHLIQTDIPVNPGNSGGALVNERGEMLGIVTLGDRRTNNIGFSIPTNVIREILPGLKTSVYQSEAYKNFMKRFGLAVQEIKDSTGSFFLSVADIQPESNAYQSGIRTNDIVIRFDQKRPATIEELLQEAARIKPGQNVYVRIQRNQQVFFTYVGAK